ncbi:MAG: tRNA lysidine(34) synthetase TilS [Bilifractor sp.]|jgi:tRNA(Ile)-lysidine synthase
MDLIREAENYIRRFHMIDKGDMVLAGVSGGADSVCLLLILDTLREKESFHLAAVHVNHNIRGEDADADEEYVRKICREREIPLYVYSFPVTDIARREKRGLEETGRLLRQQAFRDALRKAEAPYSDNAQEQDRIGGGDGERRGRKIALAHHANDLAETVLFQTARGSSLAGLAGIRPVSRIGGPWEAVQDGRKKMPDELTVIHPLLFARRKDIEAWLRERNICWRTDATNLDEEYSRNSLRHHVIPYLEEHVNSAAVRHIRELAEDAAEADEYLRAEARRREVGLVEVRGRVGADMADRQSADGSGQAEIPGNSGENPRVFLRDALLQEPEVLQRYLLMDALETASGRKKDLGREQLRQLRELFDMSAGKRIDLPYGIRAVRRYDGIELVRGSAGKAHDDKDEVRGNPEIPDAGTDTALHAAVPVTGEGIFFFGEWKFTCRRMRGTPGTEKKIPSNRYTKYFDYDKIGNNIVFRTRLAGDRIVVMDAGQTQKLKDYFINEKIPRDERDRIPLLASGQQIFWAVGGRVSEDCRITEDTENILEITAEKQEGR